MSKRTVAFGNRDCLIHIIHHQRIEVVIWRHSTISGHIRYYVTIARSNCSQVGSRHHIDHNDLIIAAELMYKAHNYIAGLIIEATIEKEQRRAKPNPNDDGVPYDFPF